VKSCGWACATSRMRAKVGITQTWTAQIGRYFNCDA
jgi:hypothetical protein